MVNLVASPSSKHIPTATTTKITVRCYLCGPCYGTQSSLPLMCLTSWDHSTHPLPVVTLYPPHQLQHLTQHLSTGLTCDWSPASPWFQQALSMFFVLLCHWTHVLLLHLHGAELVYNHEVLPTPRWHVYTTHSPLETVLATLSALPLLETTAKTTTVIMFYDGHTKSHEHSQHTHVMYIIKHKL